MLLANLLNGLSKRITPLFPPASFAQWIEQNSPLCQTSRLVCSIHSAKPSLGSLPKPNAAKLKPSLHIAYTHRATSAHPDRISPFLRCRIIQGPWPQGPFHPRILRDFCWYCISIPSKCFQKMALAKGDCYRYCISIHQRASKKLL